MANDDRDIPPETGALVKTTNPHPPAGTNSMLPMVGLGAGANVGAMAIEQQRVVAETLGKIYVAKQFPRDTRQAYADAMEACAQLSLAAVAFYAVPRGQKKVTGPSIRLAEELARCWGNIDFGHKELSRVSAKGGEHGRSEVLVYAWDMQTNTFAHRMLTVLHVIDTSDGPRPLRDQNEIDGKIANVASKQVRGRLMAILPKYLTQAAQDACKKTIEAKGGTEPLEARARKMVAAFAGLGITQAQIAEYLQHSLETMTIDDLVTMTSVYNAVTAGGEKITDYFEPAKADKAAAVNAVIAAAAATAKPPPPPPPAQATAATPPPPPAAVEAPPPPPAAASPVRRRQPPAPPPPAEAPADDGGQDDDQQDNPAAAPPAGPALF